MVKAGFKYLLRSLLVFSLAIPSLGLSQEIMDATSGNIDEFDRLLLKDVREGDKKYRRKRKKGNLKGAFEQGVRPEGVRPRGTIPDEASQRMPRDRREELKKRRDNPPQRRRPPRTRQ